MSIHDELNYLQCIALGTNEELKFAQLYDCGHCLQYANLTFVSTRDLFLCWDYYYSYLNCRRIGPTYLDGVFGKKKNTLAQCFLTFSEPWGALRYKGIASGPLTPSKRKTFNFGCYLSIFMLILNSITIIISLVHRLRIGCG